ncbi:Rne/Rng family ribonuclease [Lichenihabitans sp. Uapishka_5]|uniref:Rne/Rng family ribonuclease n=1 Tax=Lichenihabitans sp. Uapishka_5 TaxID=3037302 RepID=UPI0029E7E775|nr:Rne/Rng family ribonuclease [Lichenihabitans sp. Uapishka_5]MDX7950175.1 Rne/Rng family ribonuclease [Lichenihabitans sp. Uapishka_5]
MANKMLIDAAHPEETRVVVLRGNRVEDFDFESASKKPLRGNIYLAKVTRVEPSLQAAFIEYGGNRHGFLAFSEIHPDYYQIPVADRQALLDEEARAHREEDDEQRQTAPRRSRRRRHNGRGRGGEEGAAPESEAAPVDGQGAGEAHDASPSEQPGVAVASDDVEPQALLTPEAAAEAEAVRDETAPIDEQATPEGEASEPDRGNPDDAARSPAIPASAYEPDDHRIVEDSPAVEAGFVQDVATPTVETLEVNEPGRPEAGEDETAHTDDQDAHEDEAVEQLGGDALEDVPVRAPRLRRHYKIQEVIKRRQILLVQVVKEERGNKGAALTTYLSLAGRYSVLMPNTARGGGISRKITDSDDRKRLKAIAGELEVPEGMGIILRTAGAARGEGEVKRDFEYLLRMWETVRELTLRSSAPMLVYEEGSLIKRAIRDLYSKEIDEIVVAGDEGYREAKEFMRLLMPSQVRSVVAYRDPQPIFAKSGAEAQLDAMFSNQVTLKSGGYLVINQTEALVAIDVNSGRSTREHNIEDTAVRTNLEAADEVARQLRLRDLAGLIVVDFIDMDESRNNRAVEKRMKDALKNDRARIQIGRISHFGLLEMSRQRIRTGVLEGSTVLCPHCMGAGTVRSTSSIALHVLRVLEDNLIRSNAFNLVVRTPMDVALYILNQKRPHLTDLESRFGVSLTVTADASLTGTVYHAIDRGEEATPVVAPKREALGYNGGTEDEILEVEVEEIEAEVVVEETAESLETDVTASEAGSNEDGEGEGGGRRRRRRRRRGRDRGPSSVEADGDQPSDTGMEVLARAEGDLPEGDFRADDDIASDARNAPAPALVAADDAVVAVAEAAAEPVAAQAEVTEAEGAEAVAEPTPRRRSRRRAAPQAEAAEKAPEAEVAPAAPRRSRRSRSRAVVEEPSLDLAVPADVPPTEAYAMDAPSADRDIGADTVKNHPADAVETPAEEPALPGLVTAAEAPAGDEGLTAPAATPEPDADEPSRPKRSGWWQRAKATITGE